MSASELLRRTVAVLDEQIEAYAANALNVRRNAGAVNAAREQVQPPSTIEDIAMMVIELNAFRRGIEAAKNALVEEHKKLIAPDEVPSELGEEMPSGEEPPFYQ